MSPQHVPIDNFSANLHLLIQMVKSPTSPLFSPSTAVILLTPPPVNTYEREARLAARDPPIQLDRHFNVTKSYAEAVKAVGLQENVPVVDVWSVIYNAAGQDERKLGELLCDGLHLSATGDQVGSL
jgi:isoamyl acetate esterase